MMIRHETFRRLCIFLLMVVTAHRATSQQPVTDADFKALMNGEKVLPLNEAPLLNPVCRFAHHPWFEITGLRPGRTLSVALEMDFACTGVADGDLHVVVLTNGQQHRFPVSPGAVQRRKGVITCRYSSIADQTEFGADIEAYVELTDSETTSRRSTYGRSGTAPKLVDPIFFKVSESAIRGHVTQLTLAREIRPDELRIYTQRRRKNGPPPPPPVGNLIVKPAMELVPGTPVLAAHEGDWLPAEVLAVGTGSRNKHVIVHWPKRGHAANQWLDWSYVAVNEKVLARLKSNPEEFQPSVTLPFNSLYPPPADYVVLAMGAELHPGTPVKLFTTGSAPWDYTVSEIDGQNVQVFWDQHPTYKTTVDRRQLMISNVLASQMNLPETKTKHAAQLHQFRESIKTAAAASIRTTAYPISLPLPDDYEKVTEKTPLKTGIPCQICWARKWNPVVVQQVSDKGVHIMFDGWKTEYWVPRDNLIIRKQLPTNAAAESTTETVTTPGSPNGNLEIRLEETGARQILVMKAIQSLTGLDLKTAKEVTENAPINLRGGLSGSEAAAWQKRFEAAGAKVSITADER